MIFVSCNNVSTTIRECPWRGTTWKRKSRREARGSRTIYFIYRAWSHSYVRGEKINCEKPWRPRRCSILLSTVRVVRIIKIYDPRRRARAIKRTMRILAWDAIKRVAIYMDARVLHVTVVRPWGEKNGRERKDGDTRSPPPVPPRLLSLGLFRENPGQGRDLFPLTDEGTRCGTVCPDRLDNAR